MAQLKKPIPNAIKVEARRVFTTGLVLLSERKICVTMNPLTVVSAHKDASLTTRDLYNGPSSH